MAKRGKSKLQIAASSVENHVTNGGPTCRSTEINNDQNSTTKNTTFICQLLTYLVVSELNHCLDIPQ